MTPGAIVQSLYRPLKDKQIESRWLGSNRKSRDTVDSLAENARMRKELGLGSRTLETENDARMMEANLAPIEKVYVSWENHCRVKEASSHPSQFSRVTTIFMLQN